MTKGIWSIYISYFKGFHKLILFSFSLSIIQSVLLIPASFLIQKIFDVAIPAKDPGLIFKIISLIILLMIVNMIVSILERSITLKITKTIVKNIREQLYSKLINFPYQNFQVLDKGKIHTTIVQNTESLDIMTNALVSVLIPSTIIIISLSIFLFYLDLKLALLVYAFGPLFLLTSRVISKRISSKIDKYFNSMEEFSKGILFTIQHNMLIKIKSDEERQKKIQNKNFLDLLNVSRNMAVEQSIYKSFQEFLVITSGLLVLIFGGKSVINGTLSLGSLFSFYFTLYLMRKFQMSLFSAIPEITTGIRSIHRINNLVEIETKNLFSGKKNISFDGKLEIVDLSFQYSDRTLLKRINLKISPGKIISILGSNGSGKSTLILLILGLLKAERGIILTGGLGYNDIDLFSLRKQIGTVMQYHIIFEGTVKENITFGNGNISDADVIDTLKLAAGEDILVDLKKGIHTYIGKDGVLLSGGQYQKIAIARALIGNPRLLILDEPTNHLDSNSIELLFKNLTRIKSNMAILIISHNKEIIRYADELYILEDGNLRFKEIAV